MSQASIVMPKESTVSGIVMKADVDPALAAISTLNAGDTDPGTGPGAYALWADTGSKKLKQRNADNTDWVILCDLGAALAALAGNVSQAFSVADATEDSQAVNLGQLDKAIAVVQTIAEAAKSSADTAQKAADAAANAANPSGTIIASGRAAAPDGYLLCDGSAVSRTDYATLYAAIGTAFGAGDGSATFNLPDLRGVVLRGVDGGRGLDTGRTLGSYQADAIASHNLSTSVKDPGHIHAVRVPSTSGNPRISGRIFSSTIEKMAEESFYEDQTGPIPSATTGISVSASYQGFDETRMKNVAINYFIKS